MKRGGKYCVAGFPNGESRQITSYSNGISMFYKTEETRKKWISFVRRHRPNFRPTSSSHLCSAHFKATCFTRRQGIEIDGVSFKKTLQSSRQAKAGPRGLPPFCWYISLLKLNSTERVAVSISSMTSSGNGGLLSSLRYKASAHILMVSLKGTFVKRLLMSKEHTRDVSFSMFKFCINSANVIESLIQSFEEQGPKLLKAT